MAQLRVLAATAEPVPVPAPEPARFQVCGRPDARAARLHDQRDELAAPVEVVVLGERWAGEDGRTLLGALGRARFGGGRLVLLHSGAGGGSLLRAVAAEEPALRVTTIEAADTAAALSSVLALAAAQPVSADDFRVDAAGRVTRPGWREVGLPPAPRPMAGERVLVTGGLGGLGVRAAVHLAEQCGAHPVLLDARTPDEVDTGGQLDRLRRSPSGVTVLSADVTDAGQVAKALASTGPVAGLVHCAGRISSRPGRAINAAELAAVAEVKQLGLRTVLSQLDRGPLRFVVGYGSIMARWPHPGLAGYALANELLRREAERWAVRLSGCTVVIAEWSIWSGAGMAARVAETAAPQLFLPPVTLAEGCRATARLSAGTGLGSGSGSVVVAGAAEAPYPVPGQPPGTAMVALPGVDASLTTTAGGRPAEVAQLVEQAVRACVPFGGRAELEWVAPAASGLQVRTVVRGDRIDCDVLLADGTSVYRCRYRLRQGG